jgi:hypothetical protein
MVSIGHMVDIVVLGRRNKNSKTKKFPTKF